MKTSDGASQPDRSVDEAARETSSPWIRWWHSLRRFGGKQRSLRLRETLPLGDRRFVAVIEYEQKQFLIGGTSTALVLLTCLTAANEGITSGPQPLRALSMESRN